MLDDCNASDKGIHVELDPDFVAYERSNTFASTGLADEPPVDVIAAQLADAADDYQADIAAMEAEAAERPWSVEEAMAVVQEELPKRIYHVQQISTGYANAEHTSLDYLETICTLRDVEGKRVWTGPNWRAVLNDARADLCQRQDEASMAGEGTGAA